MTKPDAIPSALLATQGPRPACPDVSAWLPIWRAGQTAQDAAAPFAAAVACALKADRLAWAFFSGYQGALQAAFGTQIGTPGAFAANEAQRRITEVQTTLADEGGRLALTGRKAWALAGIEGLMLFVLARRAGGPATGPGSLCIVKLPMASAGVEAEPPRPQAVIPEMPHAGVRFHAALVPAADVLPGDGYADFAKPFRLREDVFVTGCVLAYLVAESAAGAWSTRWTQRAVAAVALLERCARCDPRQADTILLVAGALSFAGEVIRDAEGQWAPHQAVAQERWLRDKAILDLGKDARRQRALGAWRAHGRAADGATGAVA